MPSNAIKKISYEFEIDSIVCILCGRKTHAYHKIIYEDGEEKDVCQVCYPKATGNTVPVSQFILQPT